MLKVFRDTLTRDMSLFCSNYWSMRNNFYNIHVFIINQEEDAPEEEEEEEEEDLVVSP